MEHGGALPLVEGVGPEGVEGEEGDVTLALRTHQLEERLLGGHQAALQARQAPVAEEAECLGVHEQRSQPIEEDIVLCKGRVAHASDEVVERGVEPLGPQHPEHRPLVGQGTGADPPPVVQFAHQVPARDEHVVEEDLVEVKVVGTHQVGEWSTLQSRRIGVDDQGGDAPVLGDVGVRPDERQQHVGVVGAGGPDLLPVDDEVVAVGNGPGGEAGQVAAGTGLAHAQCSGDLGTQDRDGVVPPLPVVAEFDDRRCDDAEALWVEAAADVSPSQFLEVHHLLGEAGVASPELGRVAGNQPAAVEHLPLEGTGPGRDAGARRGTLARR